MGTVVFVGISVAGIVGVTVGTGGVAPQPIKLIEIKNTKMAKTILFTGFKVIVMPIL